MVSTDITQGITWSSIQQAISKLVRHKVFEGVVLFLIFSLVVLLVTRTYLPCFGDSASADCYWIIFCLGVLCNIFCVELCLKLIGFGPRVYWASIWNKIDAITIIISELAMILEMSLVLLERPGTKHWLLFLSGLRVVRLFSISEQFRRIIRTFLDLIPSLAPFLGVLSCIYYLWAIVGFLFSYF